MLRGNTLSGYFPLQQPWKAIITLLTCLNVVRCVALPTFQQEVLVCFKISWKTTSHFFHFVLQFCGHQGDAALQSTLTDGLASALWSMICNETLCTDMKVAARELLLCLHVFGVIYSASCHFLPKYIACSWILWCLQSADCILICIMDLHANSTLF